MSLRIRHLRLSVSTMALGLVAMPWGLAPAQNTPLSTIGTVAPGFRIDGSDIGDQSGRPLSGAGDVNGDGLADVIIGAPWADVPGGRTEAGEASVVFGRTEQALVSLSFFTGFRISGASIGDHAGSAVSGAGDVNGDGLADVLVGASGVDSLAGTNAGTVHVVFGKTTTTAVFLSALGTQGFAIRGAAADDGVGAAGSGAGDVNGDGLADIVVGAYTANRGVGPSTGQAFVIFGKTDTAPIELSDLGPNGFRIDGTAEHDQLGRSVAGAGDVNGDGLADVIVGAPGVDLPVLISGVTVMRQNAGEAMVVFGKTDSQPVAVSALGSQGFRIASKLQSDVVGKSVSGAGDINGDGLSDVIVGRGNTEGDNRGEACVVFGTSASATVEVTALGSQGFQIRGFKDTDNGPNSRIADWVDGAGDINGDGLADVIVGAPYSAPQSGNKDGKSFVVFGKTGLSTVQFSSFGTQGFRLDGSAILNESGSSVSGAGDVNGDGLADLLVGEPLGDVTGGRFEAGRSFVVFSPYAFAPLSAFPAATFRGVVAANDAPPTGVGTGRLGACLTTFPDARVWLDFDGGSGPGLAGASGVTVELVRTNTGLGGVDTATSAAIHWRLATDRTGWTQCRATVRYAAPEVAGLAEADLVLYSAASTAGPFLPVSAFALDTQRNMASGDLVSLPAVLVLSAVPPATSLNGDADADFDRDVADLTAIHNQLAGIVPPPLPGNGDVDDDLDVDIDDADALREFLVNGTPLP